MPRLLATLAVLVGLLMLGFGPPAIVDSNEQELPLYPSQMAAAVRLRTPEVTAEAWALVDGSSGAVIAGQNANERLAPASTTKIATAIVALEQGRLEDQVVFDRESRQDLDPDSSVMGLLPGEEVSLHDLLYGLMLPSGNDAAVAIAQHVGGSEQRFVQMMNAKVGELGLKDTHFVNPHGLDVDDQYSSASDLAALARYAMANPTFAAIVSTRQHNVQGKLQTYQLRNGNPLLGRYEGADGVKTGYTENAWQTFVGSASRNGHRVFVALLRSRDRVGDSIALLDFVFANYGWRPLHLPSTALSGVGAADGRGRLLQTRPASEACLPVWQLPLIRWLVWLDDGAVEPANANARLGLAGFYIGTRLLAEVSVYGR